MGLIESKNLDGWGNQIRLYAEETGTNTSGNYSSVHTWLDLYVVSGGSVNADNTRVNTTGGTESYLGNIRYGSGTHRLKDGYYDAYHNQDGTGSTFVEGYFNSGLGNWGLGGTLYLTRINRYATTNSVEGSDIESNFKVNYTSYINSYKYKLRISIPNVSMLERIDYNTSGTTFTLSQESIDTILNYTKNTGNDVKLGFAVETWNSGGTSRLSEGNEKVITGKVTNANPIFTNFDVEDVNATTVALTGSTQNNVINVNGYSNIKATITTSNKAVAQKEASMVKYNFVIGSNTPVDITYSDSSSVYGTINGATSGTYELYAVDSRKNRTQVIKQATTTINYNKVYIDILNCKIVRDDNGVGENAILTLNGTFWNHNFGQVNNSLSVSYRLRKNDSSTWTTGTTTITPTPSNDTFTFNNQIAGDNQTKWDLADIYVVEVTVSDELSSSTIELILNSGVPTLCLDKQGVGINCAYDSNIGGSLQVDGKLIDGGKILWTNSNPTSEFSSQNITLSSNDYDMLLMFFLRAKDVNELIQGMTIKGYSIRVDSVTGDGSSRRRILTYVDDTTYNVSNGFGPDGSAVNGAMVPLYVIGYKTNLFR